MANLGFACTVPLSRCPALYRPNTKQAASKKPTEIHTDTQGKNFPCHPPAPPNAAGVAPAIYKCAPPPPPRAASPRATPARSGPCYISLVCVNCQEACKGTRCRDQAMVGRHIGWHARCQSLRPGGPVGCSPQGKEAPSAQRWHNKRRWNTAIYRHDIQRATAAETVFCTRTQEHEEKIAG